MSKIYQAISKLYILMYLVFILILYNIIRTANCQFNWFWNDWILQENVGLHKTQYTDIIRYYYNIHYNILETHIAEIPLCDVPIRYNEIIM